MDGINEQQPHEASETKKVGRPKKSGETKKITIEIDAAVHKALMHFKIDKGIYVNGYIEDLLKSNVPEKYFKSL